MLFRRQPELKILLHKRRWSAPFLKFIHGIQEYKLQTDSLIKFYTSMSEVEANVVDNILQHIELSEEFQFRHIPAHWLYSDLVINVQHYTRNRVDVLRALSDLSSVLRTDPPMWTLPKGQRKITDADWEYKKKSINGVQLKYWSEQEEKLVLLNDTFGWYTALREMWEETKIKPTLQFKLINRYKFWFVIETVTDNSISDREFSDSDEEADNESTARRWWDFAQINKEDVHGMSVDELIKANSVVEIAGDKESGKDRFNENSISSQKIIRRQTMAAQINNTPQQRNYNTSNNNQHTYNRIVAPATSTSSTRRDSNHNSHRTTSNSSNTTTAAAQDVRRNTAVTTNRPYVPPPQTFAQSQSTSTSYLSRNYVNRTNNYHDRQQSNNTSSRTHQHSSSNRSDRTERDWRKNDN